MPKPMTDRHEAMYAALAENYKSVFTENASVAVYGIGNAAFRVSEILSPYCGIIGFIDRDESLAGQELYGGKIIALETAKDADAIIIAANSIYWFTIYERLHEFSKLNNIPVYNTDGTAAKAETQTEEKTNPLFEITFRMLERECEHYEVVSFDVFDTALTRKVPSPDDIFTLADIPVENFAYLRSQAQRAAYMASDGVFTLADVYKRMGLDEELAEKELETEARYIAARTPMRELFQKLVQSGKRVIFVSDMYVPKEWLAERLKSLGFSGYERLFLSNAEDATKENGKIWDIVKDYCGTDNILHIGDSVDADVLPAKNAGLAAFRIMGESEMSRESRISALDSAVKTAGDRVALGLLQDKLFNSPFALAETKGSPKITTAFDLGYCVFAPLTLALLDWLVEKVHVLKPELLLFAARDGYLLGKLWNEMRAENPALPAGVYFPISRRLCTVCSFRTEQDILRSLSIPAFSGRLDMFFQMRLGLEYDGTDGGRRIRSTDADVIALVKAHAPDILENSRIQRERYLKYIGSVLPADPAFNRGEIMLFDIGAFGSCQHKLQEICERSFIGAYLHYDDTASNAHLPFNTRTEALFYKSDGDGYETIERRNPLNEAVFTAKEGTYLAIDDNGGFVTDDVSSNSDRWDGISAIHAGITAYIKSFKALTTEHISKDYAQKALDIISQYRIDDTVADLLRFDDNFMGGGGKTRVPLRILV